MAAALLARLRAGSPLGKARSAWVSRCTLAGTASDAAPLGPVGELDLGRLPPVECVIGYGSGVFQQAGYEGRPRPMIDLVLVVQGRDIEAWHEDNMRAHPDHYAGLLRSLGPSSVAAVQKWGPGLYYNPHVKLPVLGGGEAEVKYGVISAEAMLNDLLNWDWLYLAGRLHKPFVFDWRGADLQLREDICRAFAVNRRAALSAALLLKISQKPSKGADTGEHGSRFEDDVSWRGQTSELLEVVARLSYDGDVRVGLGEDPRKVQNIVAGQFPELWEAYRPLAADLAVGLHLHWPTLEGAECSAPLPNAEAVLRPGPAGTSQRLLEELPTRFRQAVVAAVPVLSDQATSVVAAAALRAALRRTVFVSSLQQTLKGALTAGASRGARYALAKISKRFR